MCQWDSKRTSWLTAGTEPGHPGRRSPALGEKDQALRTLPAQAFLVLVTCERCSDSCNYQ